MLKNIGGTRNSHRAGSPRPGLKSHARAPDVGWCIRLFLKTTDFHTWKPRPCPSGQTYSGNSFDYWIDFPPCLRWGVGGRLFLWLVRGGFQPRPFAGFQALFPGGMRDNHMIRQGAVQRYRLRFGDDAVVIFPFDFHNSRYSSCGDNLAMSSGAVSGFDAADSGLSSFDRGHWLGGTFGRDKNTSFNLSSSSLRGGRGGGMNNIG